MSITNSRSLPKLVSIESVMPSKHLTLCCPLLLPSVFPSIRVFPSESALCIRLPKYWRFSFSPSNEHPGLISFLLTQAAKESECTGLYIWKGLFAFKIVPPTHNQQN